MRYLATGLGVLVGLTVVPVTVARLVGGGLPPPLPQLAAFAPWAAPAWLVTTLLLLLGRPRWFAAIAALVLVLHVVWLVPPRSAWRVPEAEDSVPVNVLTANVEFGQADAASVARLVREHAVDVLVVAELTPPFLDSLTARGIGGVLPYSDVHPRPGAGGTGIWSRWPLRPAGLIGDVSFRMPQAIVDVPGGPPVTVTAVHTIPPRSRTARAWERDLNAVARAAGSLAGPRILAGDFNASRDHRPFRRILDTGLVDSGDVARPSPWAGFTWPADARVVPPAVRIDHVLVDPESFAVRAVTVLAVPGTDHRAVLASAALRVGG